MKKEILHNLIDMIPDSDSNIIYNVLLKFIPTDLPLDDEILAISVAKKSIEQDGTVSIDSIDWES